MQQRILGIAIFILIIIGAVVYYQYRGPGQKSAVVLKGLVGGEKIGLLEDENFTKLLQKKYRVTIDYSKAGSIEMVKEEPGDNDFLFPSSQTALEIYRSSKKKMVKSETVFNSPLVFYTWDVVVTAFEKEGLVQNKEGIVFLVDLPKLVTLIMNEKKWSDVGLGDLYGKITIISTDPTKSNSGNMFAGLMANILNQGEVVDKNTVEQVLPQLERFFAKLGYLEHSSSDLFEQYLRTGVGAKPVIAGYENQLIEFAYENKNIWENLKTRIRILYPVPTVWSAHPVIALNQDATVLLKALGDPEVQQMAWERHGFRTGLSGVQNKGNIIPGLSVPETISKVIPLPDPEVMDKIITALEK